MISIIIPTYNHAREIIKCLKSIFNQTFQDFEIIIVNDGSTDNTLETLRGDQALACKNDGVQALACKDYTLKGELRKGDKDYTLKGELRKGDKDYTLKGELRKRDQALACKIKIITQENQGASAARNRGAQQARGEYLLFCDADLLLKPRMLEKMAKNLDNHAEISYVYSSFHFGWKLFRLWPFDPDRLKKMPYIHTASLMRHQDFPGFDESLKKFQDWDLWLTMLEQGKKGLWIPEVFFKVRPRKSGMSQWLPKIFYKIPWQKFGLKSKTIEKYKKAEEIIKQKHHLI